MSPRRNRPPGGGRPADPEQQESGIGAGSTVEWQGEEWVVRPIAGSASAKHYRCPGCDQEIPPGTGHVVAWPSYGAGVDDRRHWHRACWGARDRRASAVQRGRGAPKY